VDYLIRLEQGRSQHPSAQIIAALARALRLDDGERAILYRSAGVVPPSSGSVPRETPRGVQLMLDRLADTPIAVFSAAWDLLESNALWNELFDQGAPQTGRPRNLVWQQFTAGRPTGTSNLGAVIRSDAEVIAFERELVSDLRRAHERYPDDRALAELISTLQRDSSRFARLWSQ
jgi:MmyB-like transcription regulator ligand binding domain/Helix-turn-helix domain